MKLIKCMGIGLILLASFARAQSSTCDEKTIMAAMQQKLETINSYQFNVKSEFKNQLLSSATISGKRPIFLKVILKTPSESPVTIVFDKQFQWIDDGDEVYQLDLNKIDRNMDYPFDTPYSLSGNGLFNGEDYIGTVRHLLTIYKFIATCKGDQITLKGKLDIEKAKQYMQNKHISAPLDQFVQQFNKTLGLATVSVDPKTYLVKSYSLTGKDKSAIFTVVFTDYQFDELSDDFFNYQIPKGKTPINITPQLGSDE